MGFTLTISEGKERGREYTFSQPEVCIGRTAENDLVLTEPGVSRRHVKIRDDGGRFVVEDLGSANGTKVNGSPVTEDQLKDGDSIQVGPVVFAFAPIATEGDGATRIFDPADVEKKAAATRKARDQAARGAGGQRRAVTSVVPRVKDPARPLARAGNVAVARAGAAPGQSRAVSKRPANAVAPEPQKSASERARQRRAANTPLARVKLWWAEAPKKQRMIAGGGGGAGLLVVLLLLASAMSHGGAAAVLTGDESKVTFPIGPEPSTDTWGTGMDGVGHETVDKAQFEFIFPVTAKKAVATLHFESAGVQRPETVDVAVNTIHVGFLEPSFGDNPKAQEISIPPKYLHPNEKNRVVFDNLKNPPGQEPWYLGQVWIEVHQLPEDTPENLKRRAQAAISVGDRAWDARKIGADNTFKAWKAYEQAQLYLEAVDEKVDELDVVRQKIRDAQRELDSLCSAQMLKGIAAEKQNHADDAIAIYKNALLYFPEKDHSCFKQLHDKLNNLE